MPAAAAGTGPVNSLGVVQSWNEWDTLREVWVGSLEDKQLEANLEPAFKRKRKCYENFPTPLTKQIDGEELLNAAKVQLDNFVKILKTEGVIVQRPSWNFKLSESIKTPLWSADHMSGITCPRDLFFLAGKHMIEAPMSWRSRYFEHLAWSDLTMGMYKLDTKMRMSSCPKPMLIDDSYNPGDEGRGIRNNEFFFDAADTRRFGKDIFMHSSNTANDLGRDWVRRTLTPDGIRVNDFTFEDEASGNYKKFTHMDARVTPISEDTLIWTNTDAPTKEMFDLFKKNEWKLIEVGGRTQCRSRSDACSLGIHLNVCTLSPMKLVAEAGETALIKQLRDEGVDVIPCELSACYPFGGGLNCFTLDVYRDGPACKSYFPTLDVEAERALAKSAGC